MAELIDRINLILDGENLDGVGDNPDVINRPIKELVSILQNGGDSNVTVQKTGFSVDPTTWGTGVETGDFVYFSTSTNKYEKTPISEGIRNIGLADVTNNKITTSGTFDFDGGTMTVGRLIYLDTDNAGKFVEEGSNNASKFLLGVVLTSETILFNSGSGSSVGGGQLLGNADERAVAYLANSTSEELVVKSGTNAYAIDSITIEDGGSITIEDGSVFKIL